MSAIRDCIDYLRYMAFRSECVCPGCRASSDPYKETP